MDIRTTDHILNVELDNGKQITALICKEEFYAIMYGIGHSLTFMIRDNLGDVYSICLEKAAAEIDIPKKTMTIR